MNMQRFSRFALGIALLYGLMAHGQGLNALEKVRNAYRIGDRMVGKQLLGNVENLINDSLCDLSQATLANEGYSCRYGKGSSKTGMSRVEHGTRYLFEQRDDSLLILGFENPQAKIDYDLPELWLKFPVHAGDSFSGLYHGCGIYGGRWNVRKLGSYKTQASVCRTMVLPEGDTLQNVLRLHTQRLVCTLTSPAKQLGDSVTRFTPDSIRWHLANNSAVLVEDVYRCYVPGCRYPILEAYVTGATHGQEPFFTTAFYYSPREQACLPNDTPNNLIRQVMVRQKDTNREHVNADKGFSYKMTIDRERNVVRLAYDLAQETKVQLILSDNAGIVYKSSERVDAPGKAYVQEVDYGTLPRGSYVLYVNVNGEKYANKFRY